MVIRIYCFLGKVEIFVPQIQFTDNYTNFVGQNGTLILPMIWRYVSVRQHYILEVMYYPHLMSMIIIDVCRAMLPDNFLIIFLPIQHEQDLRNNKCIIKELNLDKIPQPPICIIGLFAVFAMSNIPACVAFFLFT